VLRGNLSLGERALGEVYIKDTGGNLRNGVKQSVDCDHWLLGGYE